MTRPSTRLLAVLKIAIPAAIIGWLLCAVDPEQLRQLQDRPKNWPRLATAFLICLTAVAVTFARWWLLVRALHMRFRLRDAFRLGSLGFLLNFVSVGSVGGDLFKAFFIAREQPGRRAEAVGTVVVDRVIGLYGLLLVTSIAVLFSGVRNSTTAVSAICNTIFACTGIGAVGIAVMLSPAFTQGRLARFLARLPKVGGTLNRLIQSLRMYRDKPLVLVSLFGMSMGVHTLLILSIYLIATGLFAHTPSLSEHFLVVPLSMTAGALPFTPAGLGSFEFAMAELYKYIPAQGAGDVVGILVALTFRLVTIAVAVVGVVYYWMCRAEIREVLRQAEQEQAQLPVAS